MELNVGREIAALQRMTVKQLRQKYAEVFGEDTNGHNKAWLVKRIAWRLQARAEGGLSERARLRATALADDADFRMNPPPMKAVPPVEDEAPVRVVKFQTDDRLGGLGQCQRGPPHHGPALRRVARAVSPRLLGS